MILPFIKNVKFFKNEQFTESTLCRICNIMKYEFLRKDQKVFTLNSKADGPGEFGIEGYGQKFYIILQGEVRILVLDKEEIGKDENGEPLTKFKMKQKVVEKAEKMLDKENFKMLRRISLINNDAIIQNINSIVEDLTGNKSSGPSSPKKVKSRFQYPSQSSAIKYAFKLRKSVQQNTHKWYKPDTNEEEKAKNARKRNTEKPIIKKMSSKLLYQAAKKLNFEDKMKFIYNPDDPYEGCYKEVACQKVGEYFGELALLSSKPRAATVLCTEDTQFASISKNEYQDIIGKIHKNIVEDKIKILKEIPCLAHYSKQFLSKVSLSLQEVSYKRGNTVFSHGDPCKYVYIVKTGEFEMFSQIESDTPVQEHPVKGQSDETPIQRLRKFYKSARSRSKSKGKNEIKVVILTEGQLFLEKRALTLKNQHHMNTVRCSSAEGQLYRIKKNLFISNVKLSEKAWFILKKTILDREKSINKRVSTIRHVYSQLSIHNSEFQEYSNLKEEEKIENKIHPGSTKHNNLYNTNSKSLKRVQSSCLVKRQKQTSKGLLSNAVKNMHIPTTSEKYTNKAIGDVTHECIQLNKKFQISQNPYKSLDSSNINSRSKSSKKPNTCQPSERYYKRKKESRMAQRLNQRKGSITDIKMRRSQKYSTFYRPSSQSIPFQEPNRDMPPCYGQKSNSITFTKGIPRRQKAKSSLKILLKSPDTANFPQFFSSPSKILPNTSHPNESKSSLLYRPSTRQTKTVLSIYKSVPFQPDHESKTRLCRARPYYKPVGFSSKALSRNKKDLTVEANSVLVKHTEGAPSGKPEGEISVMEEEEMSKVKGRNVWAKEKGKRSSGKFNPNFSFA
ncbi:unnamed protein product [Moneuplotes crassus]|uniref:Cyclic nucleotide-binding domain-containing protein n=1 Tax=Euplotes crassus TaxID=5936 RepID=A0AAD1XT85_EUPCR|nr:unnamed protein product [Moneuplotes crassus]